MHSPNDTHPSVNGEGLTQALLSPDALAIEVPTLPNIPARIHSITDNNFTIEEYSSIATLFANTPKPTSCASFCKAIGHYTLMALGLTAIFTRPLGALILTYGMNAAFDVTKQYLLTSDSVENVLSLLGGISFATIVTLGQSLDLWLLFFGTPEDRQKELDAFAQVMAGSRSLKAAKLSFLFLFLLDTMVQSSNNSEVGAYEFFQPYLPAPYLSALSLSVFFVSQLTWVYYIKPALSSLDQLWGLWHFRKFNKNELLDIVKLGDLEQHLKNLELVRLACLEKLENFFHDEKTHNFNHDVHTRLHYRYIYNTDLLNDGLYFLNEQRDHIPQAFEGLKQALAIDHAQWENLANNIALLEQRRTDLEMLKHFGVINERTFKKFFFYGYEKHPTRFGIAIFMGFLITLTFPLILSLGLKSNLQRQEDNIGTILLPTLAIITNLITFGYIMEFYRIFNDSNKRNPLFWGAMICVVAAAIQGTYALCTINFFANMSSDYVTGRMIWGATNCFFAYASTRIFSVLNYLDPVYGKLSEQMKNLGDFFGKLCNKPGKVLIPTRCPSFKSVITSFLQLFAVSMVLYNGTIGTLCLLGSANSFITQFKPDAPVWSSMLVYGILVVPFIFANLALGGQSTIDNTKKFIDSIAHTFCGHKESTTALVLMNLGKQEQRRDRADSRNSSASGASSGGYSLQTVDDEGKLVATSRKHELTI